MKLAFDFIMAFQVFRAYASTVKVTSKGPDLLLMLVTGSLWLPSMGQWQAQPAWTAETYAIPFATNPKSGLLL
jgi:hypothetical protein